MNLYHLRTLDTTATVTKDNTTSVIKVGGRPYATVAFEINKDGTVNRGVSICSEKDEFIKKVGINKAIGRLESAKKAKHNILPILSFERKQKKILKKFASDTQFKNTKFDFLGFFNAPPTIDELNLFKDEFEYVKNH